MSGNVWIIFHWETRSCFGATFEQLQGNDGLAEDHISLGVSVRFQSGFRTVSHRIPLADSELLQIIFHTKRLQCSSRAVSVQLQSLSTRLHFKLKFISLFFFHRFPIYYFDILFEAENFIGILGDARRLTLQYTTLFKHQLLRPLAARWRWSRRNSWRQMYVYFLSSSLPT